MAEDYLCSTLLKPHYGTRAERVTQSRETLLSAICKDIVDRRPDFFDLSESLQAVAALFALNEMELAAWYCCLREVPALNLNYQRNSLLLWLTAFHAKTSLGASLNGTVRKLQRRDPNLAYHMQEWRAVSPYLNPLSLTQVERSYRELAKFAEKECKVKSVKNLVEEVVIEDTHVPKVQEKPEVTDSSDSEGERLTFEVPAHEEFVWPYGNCQRACEEWEYSFVI